MFCQYCGKNLAKNQVCNCEQAKQALPMWKNNEKVYAILSYIGILWLVGLLVSPEKGDSKVRFHVGQGILFTIVKAALAVASAIIKLAVNGIFETEVLLFGYYGTGKFVPSLLAGVVNSVITFAVFGVCVFYLVKGILNVVRSKQEELPVVGKYAFYK